MSIGLLERAHVFASPVERPFRARPETFATTRLTRRIPGRPNRRQLQTGTIAACFIATEGLRGRDARLALLAGISYSSMLAITLIGNMPINLRVFRWDEQHGDSQQWRRMRRRWDRLHSARILLDSAGFVLITLAAVHA